MTFVARPQVVLHFTINLDVERFAQAEALILALTALQHPNSDAAVTKAADALAPAPVSLVGDPPAAGDEEVDALATVTPIRGRGSTDWRQLILAYLATHGPIVDPVSGRASGRLREAISFTPSVNRFTQLLSELDAEGLVVRQMNGKRTYLIALPQQVPTPEELEDDGPDDEPEVEDFEPGEVAVAAPPPREKGEHSGLAFEKRPFDPEEARLRGIRAAYNDF